MDGEELSEACATCTLNGHEIRSEKDIDDIFAKVTIGGRPISEEARTLLYKRMQPCFECKRIHKESQSRQKTNVYRELTAEQKRMLDAGASIGEVEKHRKDKLEREWKKEDSDG